MANTQKFKIDIAVGENNRFTADIGGLTVSDVGFASTLIKLAETAQEMGLYGSEPTTVNYQLRTTRCKNCKAKIFFARKNNKPLPIDIEPLSIAQIFGIMEDMSNGPAPDYSAVQFPPRLYKLTMGVGETYDLTVANKHDTFGLVVHLDVCGIKPEADIDEGLKSRWREHRKKLIGDPEEAKTALMEYLHENS